ncbi:unnamed protein product [Hymenolepis diminuta]|uniref:Conserved oligomeric Golgi complex subunit 3 n=1 Tax=Hymenolepis diminuta TaxID=6216 RepID=A0A0R3SG55_HYMDI|nr:unnamed protein product [Hymenolepis diminuta]
MCAAENIIENANCALTDDQSESIFYLNSEDFRPLPQKPRTRFESEQLPQTGQETVEIELASQFYAWLGSSSETEYSEFIQTETELLSNFENQEKYCTTIINKTDEILSILNELKEKYHSVSDKTNNLHETCEILLRKQTNLNEKADQIEEYLQSFNALFSIESRTFKDSESFLSRFVNCLNIALLMVKEGIKNSIRQVVLEIVELGDAISPENSFILLYGRFRAQASRIRSLMQLMESRADTSEKYRDVIAECQAYYLSKREALVLPVAKASIADLTSKYSRDHCELFRTTISFMLHMVEDESLLFWRFFESQETLSTKTVRVPLSLETMLTNLCNCVYDALRPFLIHVNHIEILTELCDLLVHEFIEDKSTANQNVDLTAFENMCRTLLADVQQRLIYRAHIYIKSQIQDYQPGPGDIAYPEKLEMLESITSNLQQQQQQEHENKEGESAVEAQRKVSATDSTDFHGMWYPTVRRALICISGLSRCLEVESFQGLAQNCLSACIDSLLVAQKRIETRRTPSDGQLFFIKHLLILREQVTPFNVDFRVRETTLDFSNITNAVYQVLPKAGSKLFDLTKANYLLRLLLLEGPTVIDNDVDSRRQLDRQLKLTCELFISDSIKVLTGQISLLLEKAKIDSSKDSVHPLGPPNALKEAVSASFRQLSINQKGENPSSNSLAGIRRKLALYLGNANTVSIVMRPIENGVVHVWRKFTAVIEWLLDRQDVLKHRASDLKKLGSEEEYQKILIFFIDVIQAFGKSIEVRQQVIATASVYFRRFYSRTSLKSIDPWLMAPSCLFLSSKVEEYGVIQPKSLIAACCKVVNSQYSKYFKDYVYPYRTHDVFECEFILMEAMDCSLVVFHPYRPLLNFCNDLKPHLLDLAEEHLQRAWAFANDTLRTDLCLHYPPYLIALGCVQLALISLSKNPPTTSGNASDHHSLYFSNQPSSNPLAIAEQWFSELNVDPEKVLEVVRYILAHYDLLERMDIENEIPMLIIQKMPRPVIQQPANQQQQAQGQPGGAGGSGPAGGPRMVSQQQQPPPMGPSHHHQMPPPPHPPQNPVGPPM